MKRFTIVVGCLAFLMPSLANAENSISAGVGGFSPSDDSGDSGIAFAASFLSRADESAFRWGLELGYREYSAEFFDVEDVDVQTIQINTMIQYVFNADGRLSPYLGAGVSVDINIIDVDKIEEMTRNMEVINEVGLGVGGFGIVGTDLGITNRLSLFGEARISYDVQLTESEDLDVENLGGITGMGGIRLSW